MNKNLIVNGINWFFNIYGYKRSDAEYDIRLIALCLIYKVEHIHSDK